MKIVQQLRLSDLSDDELAVLKTAKDCPFCGISWRGFSIVRVSWKDDDNWRAIWCQCGCLSSPRATLQIAIFFWNFRPTNAREELLQIPISTSYHANRYDTDDQHKLHVWDDYGHSFDIVAEKANGG